MRIAGMVVLAALSGWFVRGIRFDDDDGKPVQRDVQVVAQTARPAEPVPAIQRVPIDTGSLGKRNLFAYRVHERPVIAAAPILPPTPPAMPARVIEMIPDPTPSPIPFPYRYIGTLGTPHCRLAAFARDGEVRTVRAGERIGDFVLRTIGFESVEIEAPEGMRRIPLGQ